MERVEPTDEELRRQLGEELRADSPDDSKIRAIEHQLTLRQSSGTKSNGAKRKLKGGKKKSKSAPTALPNDFEMDVADRLIAMHGDRLRYVTGVGWFVWDRTHWQRDEQGRASEAAKHVVRQMRVEAGERDDEELWKLAKRVATARGVRSVLELAETDKRVRLSIDNMDAHPHLLACRNGTVDLRKGSIREPNPEDLLTKCAPTDYDPTATDERFEKLLEHLIPQDEARDYLQLAAGYSITGSPIEDVIFLLIGPKRAGKGTLLRAISEALGEHYTAINMDSFCTDGRRGGNPARSDLFRLINRRVVGASEISPGQQFDTGQLKALAGGDPMPVRTLHKPEIVAPVTFTIWLIANDGDLPKIRSEDEAMWERVRRIPIGGTIPEKDRDPAFRESMSSEELKSATLAWLVAGSVRWYEAGRLGVSPQSVTQAGLDLKDEMDDLGPFIREHVEFKDNAVTPKREVYDAIETWLDGEKVYKKRISAALRSAAATHGIKLADSTHRTGGKTVRAFKGLRLTEVQNG